MLNNVDTALKQQVIMEVFKIPMLESEKAKILSFIFLKRCSIKGLKTLNMESCSDDDRSISAYEIISLTKCNRTMVYKILQDLTKMGFLEKRPGYIRKRDNNINRWLFTDLFPFQSYPQLMNSYDAWNMLSNNMKEGKGGRSGK